MLGLLQPYALLILPVLVADLPASAASGNRAHRAAGDRSRRGGRDRPGGAVLLFVAHRAVGQPDPPPVTPANLAEELLRLPVGMLSPPLAAPAAAVLLVLLAIGVVLAAGGEVHRRQAMLLATWVALPPLVLCGLQLLGWGPGLVARYWTLCLPAIALGAASPSRPCGSGVGRRRSARSCWSSSSAFPSQLAFRAVDGHLGQRWRDLPRSWRIRTLRDAPLLVEGWSYRALLSNDPRPARSDGADRRPRLREGQDQPPDARSGSPAFARLMPNRWAGGRAAERARLRLGEAARAPKPSAASGPSSAEFPLLAVRCVYFGDPLGVFTTSDTALTADEADELARHISGVAPERIRCAAG